MAFPVERKYIQQAEAKLGITFPAAFVARMLKTNGGSVFAAGQSWELFPFWDQSDKNRLSRTCNDIVRETMSAREMSWFPRDGVAIATNGAGDHLLLLPDPEHQETLGPSIYLWEMHGKAQPVVALQSPFELWELERRD